jgi:O-antigen ligase
MAWLASWTWSALLGDVVSLEALLLAVAAGLFAIVLIESAPEPERLAAALVIGATGVAVVAVLQAIGVDPFAIAGWVAPLAGASQRLRVYSTLGNPNFVAAVVAAAAPLTVGLIAWGGPIAWDGPIAWGGGAVGRRPASQTTLERNRLLAAIALVLQLAALAATSSRAGALGLLVAALTWLALGLRASAAVRAALAVGVGGSLIAIACIGWSVARPLRDTAAGRLYIWQVVWPHAFDAPWAGQGPGAFELRYPEWERQARPARTAFAGPQQHAHNDYLEALVDRGLAGPVTILLILATCVRGSWRRAARKPATASQADAAPPRRLAPLLIGATAAMTALGAIACVDFPLARPTETVMFWSAIALLGLLESEEDSS